MQRHTWIVRCALGAALSAVIASAQTNRVPSGVDFRQLTRIKGNISPMVQTASDAGPVAALMKIDGILLMFRRTGAQQQSLDTLLANQQDRKSPDYHRWLTPEQYAGRFGLSPADVAQVTSWLNSAGFTSIRAARGRNWIMFSGTAAQVEAALGVQIHYLRVEGETHFAAINAPSVPAVFAPVTLGIFGLDDFYPKAPRRLLSGAALATGDTPHKDYTCTGADGCPAGTHLLAPGDLATIYDIAPLYAAGYDGSGQTIAVVGQTNIDLSDIRAFRNEFGLPPNDPQMVLVPGAGDPGFTTLDDLAEANLDLEWSGAIARSARIVYVYSKNALIYSFVYAIEQNLAPVLSISFGACEQRAGNLLAVALEQGVQQANSQGISILAASGDSGAAGCDKQGAAPTAEYGPSVSLPASIPEVTAVGGTEFNESTASYWDPANTSGNSSALAYIPEVAWNDSGSRGLAASGGGQSEFFPQPDWQVGLGLPGSVARQVPDLALTASASHDPYRIYFIGRWIALGGTSAAAPTTAGVLALVNQYNASSGQGNINPILYRLAQTSGVFHDIVTGNNIVPCQPTNAACNASGQFGYYAGVGYDPVTGLGSIDAYNLAARWNQTVASDIVLSCTPNPVYEQSPDQQGYQWLFTLTLQETAGVATTLTDFRVNGTSYASQINSFFGASTIPGNSSLSAALGYASLNTPINATFEFTGTDSSGAQWSRRLSVPFLNYASENSLTVSSSGLEFSYGGGTAPAPLSLTIGSLSGSRIPWTATSDSYWLTISPSFGSTPTSVHVSVNPAFAAPKTYIGTITISSPGLPSQSLGVTFSDTATPAPSISSVVNAASFAQGISPGSLATIFGTNLSGISGIVFPGGALNYSGVTVTVAGISAPLFAIANTGGGEQINFQVPANLPVLGTAEVDVNDNGFIGAIYNIPVSVTSPGIFEYVPAGLGTQRYAAVLKPDGSASGPSNPALRGTTVSLFVTGLGPTTPSLVTGQPGPLPPATTVVRPTVGLNNIGVPVVFSGAAPGFIGLDQINFQIPANAPTGAAVKLNIGIGGAYSQSSTIAIQ